jgi:hypothetical protein
MSPIHAPAGPTAATSAPAIAAYVADLIAIKAYLQDGYREKSAVQPTEAERRRFSAIATEIGAGIIELGKSIDAGVR